VVAVPIPMQSNPQEFVEQGDERLINCYAEQTSESQYRVRTIAGYVSVSDDVADVNCRGAIEADGFVYAVFEGGKVVKIAQDGTRMAIGHIGGSGPVHMARNGAIPFQIGCVVPSTGRYYVIENDDVEIVDTRDLPAFNSICWISGYFTLGVNDGRFFSTGINDAKSINGLDYATAEGNPDGLLGVFANRLELVLFGQKTIEFWGLLSEPDAQGSPFSRLGGAVINRGCASIVSVSAIDNSFMWVGDDGIVYRNNNYTPSRASHYGVERSIAGQVDKTAIRGSTYSANGNTFYQLSGDDFTWIFNAATQKWHEGASFNRNRLNADLHVDAWGETFCFTKINGTMFRLDENVTTEGGAVLPVTVRYPDIKVRGLLLHNFETDFVTGRAPISGASNVVEPVVELRWSKDGGASWSNPRTFSLGKQGEYRKRIRSTRMGKVSAKQGVRFEWRITDPHIVAIGGSMLNEALQ
jgi:hypothetical protein